MRSLQLTENTLRNLTLERFIYLSVKEFLFHLNFVVHKLFWKGNVNLSGVEHCTLYTILTPGVELGRGLSEQENVPSSEETFPMFLTITMKEHHRACIDL